MRTNRCGNTSDKTGLNHRILGTLKEKKMQSQRMLRVIDDDIGSPIKIVPDIFEFFKL